MRGAKGKTFKPHHYEAIGRLIVACTRLDVLLTEFICGLSNMNQDDALIVVHDMNFNTKTETIKSLLKAGNYQNDAFDELQNLISQAKSLSEYRNRVAHDAWTVGIKGTSPVTIKIAGHGTRFDRKHRPTREIQARADEADALADRLEVLAAFF